MEWLGKYFGLVEAAFTMGGMSLFAWWQFRELKRDKAARIAREEAEAASQQKDTIKPSDNARNK